MVKNKISAKNWVVIFLLLLFFASPFFIAQWFFYHKGSAVPAHLGTVNHGKLIHPLITIQQVIPSSTKIPSLNKHWTIFYVATSQNEKHINKVLDKIYRIRLALGKDFSQVGELLGSLKENTVESNPLKIPTVILSAQGAQILLGQLTLSQGIFLVDALGNIFMAYPVNIKSDDIYKDIRRLLSNQ